MKDLSVYVLVSFIACVTPGSGVLYTVTNGLRGGLRTVLASPLGTTLGVGLMSLISATGLGAPHHLIARTLCRPAARFSRRALLARLGQLERRRSAP